MATPSNSHKAPESVAFCDGSTFLDAASGDAIDNRLRHIVSASCSVVSANSLSSSSTKSSSATAAPAMGGWAAGSTLGGGPVATNTLTMQPLPSDNRQNSGTATFEGSEEDDDGNDNLRANVNATSLGGFDGGNPMILQMGAPLHPVAEFLFQLTKMLTDNNTEFIEWRNASIFVHDPPGLESEILPRYFRHSNYSSFQRQMNYFGFRKIAGKGKMAPCSYVNEHAKEDISSLLFIKRKKTGISSAAAKLMAQQNRINRAIELGGMGISGSAALGLINFNHGGMGSATRLPGADASLSFNNFSMTGGGPVVESAGNMASAYASGSLNNQASLLREQQNILAQLQHAHALAMTNPTVESAQGGISNFSQDKVNGLSMNGVVNAGLLTNDQGNVYMSSRNPVIADAAITQSQAPVQQPISSLAANGNFSAGLNGPSSSGGHRDGLLRVDSAANLRALINQQISMFSSQSEPFSWSTMNTKEGTLGSQIASSLGSSSQQGGDLRSNLTASACQGLLCDWNEILQRTANMVGAGGGIESFDGPGAASSIVSFRQLEQQLLQGNNTAGGAIFGTGGAGGLPQGFPQGYQP